MLQNFSPADIRGVDQQRFRVATKEDVAEYNKRSIDAAEAHQQQIVSRSQIKKLMDWMLDKQPETVYPARPEETPLLYSAAINMAHEATEALHAAMRAFEQLAHSGRSGELSRDAQKLLGILEKAETKDDRDIEAWEILMEAKEEGVLDELLQNLHKLKPEVREEVRRLFAMDRKKFM